MKKLKAVRRKKNWYKLKPYLHFDQSLSRSRAAALVVDRHAVATHGFSPLIHYHQVSRRFRRNKETRQLEIKKKKRNIFIPPHTDGYIFSYYSHLLGISYEQFLTDSGLSDQVLAYRSVSINGKPACNIQMAGDVFNYVKTREDAHIIAIDISAFFDSISPKTLKANWCKVLRLPNLPADHYNVYSNLVNFSYVTEKDCYRHFGHWPRYRKETRSEIRLGTFEQLREAHSGFGIIKNKAELKITGIPQGTQISGMAANIAMIDFDLAMKKYCDNAGGLYRRYSDDILVVMPSTLTFSTIRNDLDRILTETCAASLAINHDKTEQRRFLKIDGVGKIVGDQQNIQYLGFIFDGQTVRIRNSSISKNKGQTARTVRELKKRKGKINTRAVYKKQSTMIMSPYDDKKAGFVGYARRAEEVFGSHGIEPQLKKNSRYIKKKIAEERMKRRRKVK